MAKLGKSRYYTIYFDYQNNTSFIEYQCQADAGNGYVKDVSNRSMLNQLSDEEQKQISNLVLKAQQRVAKIEGLEIG